MSKATLKNLELAAEMNLDEAVVGTASQVEAGTDASAQYALKMVNGEPVLFMIEQNRINSFNIDVKNGVLQFYGGKDLSIGTDGDGLHIMHDDLRSEIKADGDLLITGMESGAREASIRIDVKDGALYFVYMDQAYNIYVDENGFVRGTAV